MISLRAEKECKRFDVFLCEQTGLTRSRAQKLIENGNATLRGRAGKPSDRVEVGDVVEYEIPTPKEYAVQPENIPLSIVYEDDDFAVVNKPQGMTVHVGNGNENGTLVNALLYSLKSLSGIGGVLRPGIVHRIDKDTSGLLVVAKNDRAHLSLSDQIAKKTCHRMYFALLEGNVKDDRGRIETQIGRSPKERTKMAVLRAGEGKTAITDFETVCRFGSDYTLCKFTLQTGRTHQIRVHAKYMGHPVVGDPVYGYKKQKFDLRGQLLHATKLELTHPTTGQPMEFFAPLPDYFEKVLKTLCAKYGVREKEWTKC